MRLSTVVGERKDERVKESKCRYLPKAVTKQSAVAQSSHIKTCPARKAEAEEDAWLASIIKVGFQRGNAMT